MKKSWRKLALRKFCCFLQFFISFSQLLGKLLINLKNYLLIVTTKGKFTLLIVAGLLKLLNGKSICSFGSIWNLDMVGHDVEKIFSISL